MTVDSVFRLVTCSLSTLRSLGDWCISAIYCANASLPEVCIHLQPIYYISPQLLLHSRLVPSPLLLPLSVINSVWIVLEACLTPGLKLICSLQSAAPRMDSCAPSQHSWFTVTMWLSLVLCQIVLRFRYRVRCIRCRYLESNRAVTRRKREESKKLREGLRDLQCQLDRLAYWLEWLVFISVGGLVACLCDMMIRTRIIDARVLRLISQMVGWLSKV